MEKIINDLYNVILERKSSLEIEDGSYTKYLFKKGEDKILKKVGEECTEVIIASKEENKNNQISEMADLIYHLLVLMVEKNISIAEISEELEKRRKKINNNKGDRKIISNL